MTRYNETTLSREELEARLTAHLEPTSVLRVLNAFDMAYHVHEGQVRNDGSPYFFHCARVAAILINELNVVDPDVVIAALLHDVLEDSNEITASVLEYNFGSYVTYLVEVLTKNLAHHIIDPDGVDLAHVDLLARSSEDCLLIKLAARLDNFRCLEFNLKSNPYRYIENTLTRYVPLAEASPNPLLLHLVQELRRETNKFLG